MLIPFKFPLPSPHGRGSIKVAAHVRGDSAVNKQSGKNLHRYGVEFEIVHDDGRPLKKVDLDSLGLKPWQVLEWVDNPLQLKDVLSVTYPNLIDGYRITGGQATIDESQDNHLSIRFAVVRKPLDSLLFQTVKKETTTA